MSHVRSLIFGCQSKQVTNPDPTALLAETLERASRSPWYRERVDEDLALCRFPVLTKEQLREHPDELLVGDVPRPLRRWVTTGGTSGSPVGFWLDHAIRLSEWRFMTHQWQARVDYPRAAWRAVLRGAVVGQHGDRLWRVNYVRRELQMSTFALSADTLSSYVAEIARRGIRFLHAYPSSATRFADLCLQTGLPLPRFRALLLSSEGITDSQRAWLERTYKAPVFDFYGLSEKVLMGGPCPHSRDYHLYPGYGFAEIVGEGDEPIVEPDTPGRLVGTGFLNRCAPLVRYDTGDLASWASRECACGWKGQRIRGIHGRAQDVLRLPTGAVVSAAAVNMHSRALDAIKQLQYFQERLDRVVLRVVPTEAWTDEQERLLLEHARQRLVGAEVAVELVERIEPGSNGKVRYVMSNLEGSNRPGRSDDERSE